MKMSISDEELDSLVRPSLICACAGDWSSLGAFLSAGGPVDCADSCGTTLLHAAAEGWQYHVIEFLIGYGAKVNAQDRNGDTALHTLVRSGTVFSNGDFLDGVEPETARLRSFMWLLTKADPLIQNTQGANALHLAAHLGDDTALLHLMMDKRIQAQVDTLTSKGATALSLAVLGGHVKSASILISHKADVFIEVGNGVRVIDFVRSSDLPTMRELANGIAR